MARKKKTPPPPPPSNIDDPDRELNDYEARFVNEYLVDRCAAAAMRRIRPEYSHTVAASMGYQLRHRPCIDREIRAAVRAQSLRTRITADRALREIARIAFSDIIDLYDPHTGELYNPRNIPLEMRRAVSSVKVSRERRREERSRGVRVIVTDTVVEYKLYDKLGALEKLCRHLGLNTEITPLEAFLQLLPPDVSAEVRKLLAAKATANFTPSANGVHKKEPALDLDTGPHGDDER